MLIRLCMLLGCALLLATSAQADRIVLKGGCELVGDVLKSDDKSLVVDLGCLVVQLPRNEVLRIDAEAQAATQPAEGSVSATQPARAGQDEQAWQLYRTADLEKSTIEKNSQRFGEAVVMVTSPDGQGSGFIITPDGYLITNFHVIAGETKIKITVFHRTATGFEQKHYKKVRIIAINPFVDLALLKIEDEVAHPFKYVYLGSMDDAQVGQEVFAIGNPLGLTRTVSQGIISTKNRNFEGKLYIQTTTDINPGNSGGPLFNMRGEVVGVTSMGYLFLGGLNFAIPVDEVKHFIVNRDAFAYDEDNPNNGYRYLQPAERQNKDKPPLGRLPAQEPVIAKE